jgi:hypothetical protein
VKSNLLYNEAANAWMTAWKDSRWGKVLARLNKKEQAQLKQVVEMVSNDMLLFSELLTYYFCNFNEKSFEQIRWKHFIPSPGHFLSKLKEIHALYLNIQANKVITGQFDGTANTLLGDTWNR